VLKCDLRLNLKVRGFPLRWFRIDMANEYLIEIDFFFSLFFSMLLFYLNRTYFKSYMCVYILWNVIQNISSYFSLWCKRLRFSNFIFTEYLLNFLTHITFIFMWCWKFTSPKHKFCFILKLFTSWFRFTWDCYCSVMKGMRLWKGI